MTLYQKYNGDDDRTIISRTQSYLFLRLSVQLMPLPFTTVIQVFNQGMFSEALLDCSKFAIDKVCLGAKRDLFLWMVPIPYITLAQVFNQFIFS